MRSKPYAAKRVNEVVVEEVLKGRDGQAVVVGVDVGKFELQVVARWGEQDFERPWRVANPAGIPVLVGALRRMKEGRSLRAALEPSGTYGDALRQGLHDAGIETWRVSPKASHDYAEVFDGVPSQHDGKDAAVVAELAATGKASIWRYQAPDAWEQELTYWVEWLEGQRRMLMLWVGRVEALLARHWPEATRVLRGSSGTLLRVLATYGGPAELAADAEAEARLRRWGGKFLSATKAKELLACARSSVGVRSGEWERRQLQDDAREARRARQEMRRGQRELRRLAQGHEVLTAMGRAVGVPTACVLWVSTGDPRPYDSGAAYRKALGLNLKERSSGTQKGVLRISKRGHPRSRQWLYFAALRLVQQGGVRRWYEAKKARDGQEAKRALVGVMRKLALALYRVAQGEPFVASRLFPGTRRKPASPVRSRTCAGSD
jgi:transposase